eukprot:419241_1
MKQCKFPRNFYHILYIYTYYLKGKVPARYINSLLVNERRAVAEALNEVTYNEGEMIVKLFVCYWDHRKIDEDYDGIAREIVHREIVVQKKKKNSSTIRFADLSVIGILGRGSFGSVDLVVHSGANGVQKTYALKTVSKAQVVRTGQQVHIVSEKNVMMMLDCAFIVKLYCTYKCDKYLYFLLEVVLGGELFTVLRARTVFDESTARFYAASVCVAFDYMHSKSIIYRDLKLWRGLVDIGRAFV